MGSHRKPATVPGQLALFVAERKPRPQRYVPKYEGDYSQTIALLDGLLAKRKGLKPYEGAAPVAGRSSRSRRRTAGDGGAARSICSGRAINGE
jgi:hypothetical protein